MDWPPEKFGTHLAFMEQTQRAVRATATWTAEKMGFFGRALYLLGCLQKDQHVAKSVIDQLNDTGESNHHRVTLCSSNPTASSSLTCYAWRRQERSATAWRGPLAARNANRRLGLGGSACIRRLEVHARGDLRLALSDPTARAKLGPWKPRRARLSASLQFLLGEYLMVPNMKRLGRKAW